MLPGRSAFVESPSRRSTPRFPIAARAPTSVLRPSTGVWSSFQSPVWTTRPADVSTTSAVESGIECATRTSSMRNGPSSSGGSPGSAATSSAFCPSPCSSSFDFTSARVSGVATTAVHVDLAQEVRQAADVVLVAVRQHDGPDAAPDEVADVRQEQIDPEVLVPREREARVDDDDLAAELVHGHVLPDLAEAAERDDAQGFAHRLSLRSRPSRGARRRRARAARAARGSRVPRRARRPSPRRAAGGDRPPRVRAG